MIKNSGLTVFGSTCLTPSISLLLSSSSPSVRCKHHCKIPLLWGRHHCSDLWSQSSVISMLITITNIDHDHWSHGDDHRHDRNHGDDKLINVVLPWNWSFPVSFTALVRSYTHWQRWIVFPDYQKLIRDQKMWEKQKICLKSTFGSHQMSLVCLASAVGSFIPENPIPQSTIWK